MNWQEYDSAYDDGDDGRSGRPRRTKFRETESHSHAPDDRIKRSGKKSHRQKTIKDDYWAAHNS
jgi:hypothetical protein